MGKNSRIRRAWHATKGRRTVARDLLTGLLAGIAAWWANPSIFMTDLPGLFVVLLTGGGVFGVMFAVEFGWQLAFAPYRALAEESDRLRQKVASLTSALETHATNQQRCDSLQGLTRVYWAWKELPTRIVDAEYPLAQMREDMRTLDFAIGALATHPGVTKDLEALYSRAIFVPGATASFMDPASTEEQVRWAAQQKIRRIKRIMGELDRRIRRSAQ